MNALVADIEAMGGDEVVMDLIADGKSLLDIANTLNVSRSTLRRWLKKGGEERAKLLAQARRESGEAHVERAGVALEHIDATGKFGELTAGDVQLAKARSEFHRWLAGKRDRAFEPNQGAQGNLTFNVHTLHLNALMKHGGADQLNATPKLSFSAGDDVVDAEVVEVQDEEADPLS